MTNEQKSLIVLLCGEMYESSRNIGRLLGSRDTPHAAAIFEIGCSNEA